MPIACRLHADCMPIACRLHADCTLIGIELALNWRWMPFHRRSCSAISERARRPCRFCCCCPRGSRVQTTGETSYERSRQRDSRWSAGGARSSGARASSTYARDGGTPSSIPRAPATPMRRSTASGSVAAGVRTRRVSGPCARSAALRACRRPPRPRQASERAVRRLPPKQPVQPKQVELQLRRHALRCSVRRACCRSAAFSSRGHSASEGGWVSLEDTNAIRWSPVRLA